MDITSNIANIDIGQGMDVDSHSGQLEASSGGMCLATYILNEPQLLESDVEMIH